MPATLKDIRPVDKPRDLTRLLIPDFDGFAASHSWIGQKIGKVQQIKGGFAQQFQAATAYGGFGGDPMEVHGAIRDKYVQLNGPEGFLGFPTTNETGTPDGNGRFNHFENGSIYWHPSTGAFEVHGAIRNKWASLGWENGFLGYPTTDELTTPDGAGRYNHFERGSIYWTNDTGAQLVVGAIRDKWASLGWERSWLGYPISDETEFTEADDGRISVFQNGAIYWWPDTGPLALNDVVVHYTGVHCFAETDVDGGSDSDEPYATIGITAPDGTKGTFRSRIYEDEDVDAGEGVFDVIEIYRGKPRGLVISTILQEHSGGNTEISRAAMNQAVDKGGAALAAAATHVPHVGPVLGPLTSLAFQSFKKDIVDALNSFVEGTLGFADRPLGSDVKELSVKDMVVLATRAEGHAQFNAIPWRFETSLLERWGASYKVYFNIFPA